MKKWIAGAVVLAVAGTLVAGPLRGRPNLKMAHRQIKGAMASLERAQRANEYDMDGHAAKAEALLIQAEREISMAAMAAHRHEMH